MAEITEIVMVQDGLGDADDDWLVSIATHETAPPRLLLQIGRRDGEIHEVWVGLGDTFALGEQTWRFEDIQFRGTPDHFFATLRYVPPGAPPFTPPPLVGDRVWHEVELRHHGGADEAQIAQFERELGAKLPPLYRRWLAEYNGATATQNVTIPGSSIILGQHAPMLGIRPDEPYLDLRYGPTLAGGMFTDDYVVIANAVTGLIAVKISPPEMDLIVGLDDQSANYANAYQLAGYETPAEYVCRELIRKLAPDIYAFEAYLQPTPPLPPAAFA